MDDYREIQFDKSQSNNFSNAKMSSLNSTCNRVTVSLAMSSVEHVFLVEALDAPFMSLDTPDLKRLKDWVKRLCGMSEAESL
jgi:hypothetical protein